MSSFKFDFLRKPFILFLQRRNGGRDRRRKIMKLFLIAATAAAVLFCVWLGAQSTGTSPNYSPARYALIQGSVTISNITDSGGMSNNIQQCMFKLDTRTGETWVVQLAVNGAGDPTVGSAVWAKVQDSGKFYPNGPPLPQD